MASFVPSSPETILDRELYTSARLTQIACLDCLASVGVKKNSEHQTSIQWTPEAEEHCPELTRQAIAPPRLVQRTCPRLLASIDTAVRDGALMIGAEDGY